MHDLVLFLSDIHHGAHTDEFDPLVSRRRQTSIPEQLPDESPRRVVVALGGDLVEGTDIHPSQNAMIRYSARRQAQEETDILVTLIDKLAEKYSEALIGVREVYGNHGRTSRSAHLDNNWDLVIGDNLARHYKGNARVRVKANTKVSEQFRLGKTTFLMQHKTKASETHTTTNAIMGRVLRRLRAKKADVFLLAHFHRGESYELDGELCLVVNGSVKGGGEAYSDELGVWTPPKQAVITVPHNRKLVQDDVRWLRW